MRFINILTPLLLLSFSSFCQIVKTKPGWPSVTEETKPWTRWWWHGSAVTKAGITAEMEAYQKAGLGGLEITPIYGVKGYEDKFVNYLSPEWMELLKHVLKEAKRLGLGIDMATGTGWPFGGPWISQQHASKNINYKIYTLKEGERLVEKITFTQAAYIAAVGKKVNGDELIEPITANKNLQSLALDQVRFAKQLPLEVLMAYNDTGEARVVTQHVDSVGVLNWTAPAGTWKLYALFSGWHGKMVERAGPGGEGYVIDHFSGEALKKYLTRFDSAFAGNDIQSLRAFFNDSYEVDDAKGSANWTPALLQEFNKRRGYDLRDHLPALFGHDGKEKNARVVSDYRETISELLYDNFTQQWRDWAHGKSALVRNQAHGSPSNILDLYAAVDIPEIEGIEPLRLKMASSAANVTGKRLVSSETATWLNEHFTSNLSAIKLAIDQCMLNGVNHIFYHGTAYSPPGEPWPGWLFYAAVHLNPRNSLWNDVDALNNYVTRCQSFLQKTTSANDVLLYFPIYDRFASPAEDMIEHFDGVEKLFKNTSFERCAEMMLENGYTFDYLSDRQLQEINYVNKNLVTSGKSLYKTIVIPRCQYIPFKTFQKLIELVEAGATLIMAEDFPATVSGYMNYKANEKIMSERLDALRKSGTITNQVIEMKAGQGKILMGNDFHQLLINASVRNEKLVERGLQFIRKRTADNRIQYFLHNNNDTTFTGWLPLETRASAAVIYNPLNDDYGAARIRINDKKVTEVFVQLTTHETLILECYNNEEETEKVPFYRYFAVTGKPLILDKKWKITFLSGGPLLPEPLETEVLKSWTAFGPNYSSFSGTASYTTTFTKPDQSSKTWKLAFDKIGESADVFLNGRSLGTLIGPVYEVYIDASLLQQENKLEVNVSNRMANRIADMDRNGVSWKKFYNINFPSRIPSNNSNGLFTAAHWPPTESGLMGPVKLIPVGPSK
jgi:hypothetical protein